MDRNSLTVALACVLAVLLAPATARAQEGEAIESFTCESQGNTHNECRYRASGQVTVHVNRQLSDTRCVFNQNWGTFDGGVWVDYGCRAEFVVRRPPGSQDAYRPVGGGLETVRCESVNNAYQQCRVPDIDISSVTLERQLSGAGCSRGYSWGVSDGENSPPGIWVDKGCRADFSYATANRQYRSYAGTPHDFELPCESLRGAWNHCNVHQVHLARVELIAGNDECRAYKAWGVDDTGIWVRDNCQGAFRISYRH